MDPCSVWETAPPPQRGTLTPARDPSLSLAPTLPSTLVPTPTTMSPPRSGSLTLGSPSKREWHKGLWLMFQLVPDRRQPNCHHRRQPMSRRG